jgi:hypothetical protein
MRLSNLGNVRGCRSPRRLDTTARTEIEIRNGADTAITVVVRSEPRISSLFFRPRRVLQAVPVMLMITIVFEAARNACRHLMFALGDGDRKAKIRDFVANIDNSALVDAGNLRTSYELARDSKLVSD